MIIDWQHFTPWSSFVGGMLIGLASALLILLNGRIAGISGITAGILRNLLARSSGIKVAGDHGVWRIAFVAGLVLAPLLVSFFVPLPTIVIDAGWAILLSAGLLVGIGTRYGAGCTSGHGVCGIARLSPRSLVATACFMASGFATTYVLRHLIGG